MRKIAFTFALLCFCLIARAGRVVTDSIYSKAMNCHVLFNVYLPDGFTQSADKYPVVYLLHGLTGTHTDWEYLGNVRLTADELISSGEAQPMVIIMPNAGHPDRNNHWNGYFDMPGRRYETFFFTELLPAAETKYKAIGNKANRAIMGLSMGGGVSIVYAQKHPDKFSSSYAMSPWLESTDALKGNPNRKDKFYYLTESIADNSAIRFISDADETTKQQLRTVKWFFDCGDDDFLFDSSINIFRLYKAANIRSELRIRNGTHNWEYWRASLRLALPFASRGFAE